MQLSIEIIKDENAKEVAVVLIPGTTLDASNTKKFKSDVAPLATAGARVIFDLSNLKFVDSSGLGAMLSSLRQINGVGGDLKLCAMSKPVRALIELVRMHRVFEIYNTRQEALLSFGIGGAALV
jgi:anti-sigma B factor antagonist